MKRSAIVVALLVGNLASPSLAETKADVSCALTYGQSIQMFQHDPVGVLTKEQKKAADVELHRRLAIVAGQPGAKHVKYAEHAGEVWFAGLGGTSGEDGAHAIERWREAEKFCDAKYGFSQPS